MTGKVVKALPSGWQTICEETQSGFYKRPGPKHGSFFYKTVDWNEKGISSSIIFVEEVGEKG